MVENTFVRKDQDGLTHTFDISIFAIYCTGKSQRQHYFYKCRFILQKLFANSETAMKIPPVALYLRSIFIHIFSQLIY